jgi:NADH-quinone oxidoreductase subunit A
MKFYLALYSLEYVSIFVFLIFSLGLAFFILGLAYLLSVQNPDFEKNSVYECGFEPYEDSRNTFEIRFFIVGILFLLFDIEALFIYPWSVNFYVIDSLTFWVMFDFIIELLLGFFYLWQIGGLIWE